jgi:hypothetical protein
MPSGQPHGLAVGRMAHARNRGMKLIFLTGQPDFAELAEANGRVFTKPVDSPALEAELRTQLSL